jgi:hypothetical protein
LGVPEYRRRPERRHLFLQERLERDSHPGRQEIYCTAEILDGVGTHISLAFVSGSSIIWQGPGDDITDADWSEFASYSLPNGNYSCRVSINGGVITQLPFTIT